MTGVIVESSVLIVLLIGFRRLCRSLISMRAMYALWLPVVFSMLPFDLVPGGAAHSVILNVCSRLISLAPRFIPLMPDHEFVRFDFSAIHPSWYLRMIWALGSALVFLWGFLVNFRFEKKLFENRVRVQNENCPYPIYYVPDLKSSCVFKVKGEKGIYLQKEIWEDSEVCRTILGHEICHLRAKDLFWAKLRLLFVAVYWFNPLVWIAAFLSKEDCEMSCDERTIAMLKMEKVKYGKILLDTVHIDDLRVKEDVFLAATTMVSSGDGLKLRIKRLVAREHNQYVKLLTGSAFVLACVILCFFGKGNLHGMDEEDTIKQYVYYSNVDHQEGMKQLSLYREWDYFFPNELKGEILDIQKVDRDAETKHGDYSSEIYQVKMRADYEGEDGVMEYNNYSIYLVKETMASDWKIDWRY